MAHELPAKLRLTMALLGCDSRKALGARFHAANPRTSFDVERCHKWLQGRSKPRNAQIYDDWALLLGTDRSGGWLAACTPEAFLDEVCGLFNADRADLRQRAGLAHRGDGYEPEPGRAIHYLCGLYAAYSHAWSPYHRGELIRGSLHIRPGRGLRFPAAYRQALPGGPIEVRGTLAAVGRALHAELRDAGESTLVSVTAFLPGWPASVLCGVMSGATTVGPDPDPSATRIVFVRVPADVGAVLEQSNRYMAPDVEALAADLTVLGVAPAEPDVAAFELDRLLSTANGQGALRIEQIEQMRLASYFDRATG